MAVPRSPGVGVRFSGLFTINVFKTCENPYWALDCSVGCTSSMCREWPSLGRHNTHRSHHRLLTSQNISWLLQPVKFVGFYSELKKNFLFNWFLGWFKQHWGGGRYVRLCLMHPCGKTTPTQLPADSIHITDVLASRYPPNASDRTMTSYLRYTMCWEKNTHSQFLSYINQCVIYTKIAVNIHHTCSKQACTIIVSKATRVTAQR